LKTKSLKLTECKVSQIREENFSCFRARAWGGDLKPPAHARLQLRHEGVLPCARESAGATVRPRQGARLETIIGVFSSMANRGREVNQ
jgi:hypothetical protein